MDIIDQADVTTEARKRGYEIPQGSLSSLCLPMTGTRTGVRQTMAIGATKTTLPAMHGGGWQFVDMTVTVKLDDTDVVNDVSIGDLVLGRLTEDVTINPLVDDYLWSYDMVGTALAEAKTKATRIALAWTNS